MNLIRKEREKYLLRPLPQQKVTQQRDAAAGGDAAGDDAAGGDAAGDDSAGDDSAGDDAAGDDSSAAGDSEGLPWHAPDGPEWKGIPWVLIHKQTGQPAMRGCGYPPSSAVDANRDSTKYVMRKDTRQDGDPSIQWCRILAWKL